jgi:hypothetical protein
MALAQCHSADAVKEMAMRCRRSVETLAARVVALGLVFLLIKHDPARAQSGGDQDVAQAQKRQLLAGLTVQPDSPLPTPPESSDAHEAEVNPSSRATGDVPAVPPQTTADEEKSKGYLNLYGFVEFDLGYNFRTIDPDWYDSMRPTKLPTFSGEFGKNGSTWFSIRPTRFGTQGMYRVGSNAGQVAIRPRKFYGEIASILAGQTNTNFMDIDVFPNIFEYWGPNGMVFIRQPQLRWTPIKGDTILAVAIEQPGASADAGALADRIDLSNVKGRFQWPDFTASVKHSWGKSYIRGAGVVRSIKIDNLTTNNTQSIVGWGFNVSSNVAFHKDVLRLQYAVGEGIENYMNDAPVDVTPELNPSNPAMPIKGKPAPLQSLVSYLDHNWSDKWSTSVGYSSLRVTNTSLQTPDAFHLGQYATINLLCAPFKNFLTGGEFQYGRRSNMSNGYHANDYKLQFSFKYSWDFRVLGRS